MYVTEDDRSRPTKVSQSETVAGATRPGKTVAMVSDQLEGYYSRRAAVMASERTARRPSDTPYRSYHRLIVR
jgi:hypothetical protein